MPTRRGWILLVGVGGLVGGGRLLGLPELYVLGATAGALAIVSFSFVHLARVRLDARRSINPSRVEPGGACVAELEIANRGLGSSPVMLIRDPVRGASVEGRFLLPPLSPGQHESVAYLLPTERRGVFQAGPLNAEVSDPFGLFLRTIEFGSRGLVTVVPTIEGVSALPGAASGDGDATITGMPRRGGPADEFSGLRPYAEGDDLRRVHWPSTAKLGSLVVRQEEQQWDGRTTILMDQRRRVHSSSTLEAVLSAVASIASASCGAPFRVVGTDGADSLFGVGVAHLDRVLRGLAAAKWSSSGDLVSTIARASRGTDSGALVAVTTSSIPETDLARLVGSRARFRLVVLVLVERQGPACAPPVRRPPEGVVIVRVPSGSRLRPAWEGSGPRAARIGSPSDAPRPGPGDRPRR